MRWLEGRQSMESPPRHVVALGGLGGDSHSVGLSILRHALVAEGYSVVYLGTQNRLEQFFELAGICNVVMISCMDGHARHYLRGFPELMKKHRVASTLFYLGGNLTMADGIGYGEEFLELGLSRVFLKFVDLETVLDCLRRDLASIVPRAPQAVPSGRREVRQRSVEAIEELLPRSLFLPERREVLQQWKTGPGAASLEANGEFLAAQPSLAAAQAAVQAGSASMLVQPRSGVALVAEQLRLFGCFKASGARVLSYQVDSLTRNNSYEDAERAISEALAGPGSELNGFPVVNHGVEALRRIISAVAVPLQTRHSTRDPRLLAEISYAGGVTAFEGGAICYNIPYYKDYPLDESIRRWQYVDHLTGIYYERFGIVLDREFFGVLTGTLIPPSLAIVVGILEAILAAQQKVRSVSLGYAEQGHRLQDVAAIRAMGEMATETLANLGFHDVRVNTVFHQYMAAFPADEERARQLIRESAITGALAGATRMIIKTPVEARRIPTLHDNLGALALVLEGVTAAEQYQVDASRVAAEAAWIREEVRCILDSVLFAGGGSIVKGIVEGFRRGSLDLPFAPSVYNRGEVVTARDAEGAVRFLEVGGLPFGRELREFHRDRMQERLRAERLTRRQGHCLVERDVLRLPRGEYGCWPLFNGAEKVAWTTDRFPAPGLAARDRDGRARA